MYLHSSFVYEAGRATGLGPGNYVEGTLSPSAWVWEERLGGLPWLLVLQKWRISHLFLQTAAAAKSLQSCPTLCDPRDGSPRGSPVPGIFQARTLEWVAISFSNAGKWKVKVKSPSHTRLPVTTRTLAHQAPPSMGFSRQEYWSGVPLPSPSRKLGSSKKRWLAPQTLHSAIPNYPASLKLFAQANPSIHSSTNKTFCDCGNVL